MIIFVDRAEHISVIRLGQIGTLSDKLGRLCKVRKGSSLAKWIWDVSGTDYFRSGVGYWTFDHSEKRQVIRLLDKLNGIDYRSDSGLSEVWQELTGWR